MAMATMIEMDKATKAKVDSLWSRLGISTDIYHQ
jgi:hypothetical protein